MFRGENAFSEVVLNGGSSSGLTMINYLDLIWYHVDCFPLSRNTCTCMGHPKQLPLCSILKMHCFHFLWGLSELNIIIVVYIGSIHVKRGNTYFKRTEQKKILEKLFWVSHISHRN